MDPLDSCRQMKARRINYDKITRSMNTYKFDAALEALSQDPIMSFLVPTLWSRDHTG